VTSGISPGATVSGSFQEITLNAMAAASPAYLLENNFGAPRDIAGRLKGGMPRLRGRAALLSAAASYVVVRNLVCAS
jgi:hypothetical protein